MGRTLHYVCDQCQKIKGEANRWWVVTAGRNQFSINHFSSQLADNPSAQLACSSRCLNQAISVWCEEVTKGDAAPQI